MGLYDPDEEDKTIYKVVINHEEQYSIWPADRENPLGWFEVGKSGPKQECLAYIEETWTDMRPLSLRKKMEEWARTQAAVATEEPVGEESAEPEVDPLVKRLSEGDHPVEVTLRPAKNIEAFKRRLEIGHAHIKFTETRGGTELGVTLDRDALDLSGADLEKPGGTVHLEGTLKLNYVKVRCVADIGLETFTGKGRLVILPD